MLQDMQRWRVAVAVAAAAVQKRSAQVAYMRMQLEPGLTAAWKAACTHIRVVGLALSRRGTVLVPCRCVHAWTAVSCTRGTAQQACARGDLGLTQGGGDLALQLHGLLAVGG